MNFGALQIVTAWRLTKHGVICQGIVMDGPEGVRLVVIEDQQIREWTRFGRIFDLRQHVETVIKARRQAGWVPWVSAAEDGQRQAGGNVRPHSRRRREPAHTLLRIAEHAAS